MAFGAKCALGLRAVVPALGRMVPTSFRDPALRRQLSYFCALAARTDSYARMNSSALPIKIPSLDDRRYQQLVEESSARIPTHKPEWSNFNASDPGVTLIPLFAFLTESLLYRASQIPEHNRNRFLRLFGMLVRFSKMARDDITPKLTYPGIYVEEVPSGVRAISGVPTSVTGTIATAALNQSIHLPCPRKILRWGGSERRTFLGLGAILILAGTFFVGKLLAGGDLEDEQRAHLSKRSKSKPD